MPEITKDDAASTRQPASNPFLIVLWEHGYGWLLWPSVSNLPIREILNLLNCHSGIQIGMLTSACSDSPCGSFKKLLPSFSNLLNNNILCELSDYWHYICKENKWVQTIEERTMRERTFMDVDFINRLKMVTGVEQAVNAEATRETNQNGDVEKLLNVPTAIIEGPQAYSIVLEIPGIEKSDFSITIKEGTLSVSGEKLLPKELESARRLKREAIHGRFEKQFKLSDNLDTENVTANYHYGHLHILLPKLPEKPFDSLKITIH